MKRFFVTAIALLIAAPVFCGLNISVFGGYTTLNLSTFNRDIDIYVPNFTGTNETCKKVKLGGGLMAGVDAGYSFLPGLSAVVRLEYIGAFEGGVYGTYKDGTLPEKSVWNISLMPVLAGLSYNFNFDKSPLSAGLTVLTGPGFANVHQMYAYNDYNHMDFADYYGGALTTEVEANAGYKISVIDLSLQLGYRICYIPTLRTDGHNSWFNPAYEHTNEYLDYDYNIMRGFNFNGITAKIKASYAF